MNSIPSSLPEVPIIPQPPVEELKIGTHIFKKIDYNDLKPGDIVCTYESTTTTPAVTQSLTYQKMVSSADRDQLYKMLHLEIILKKHPRKGFYDIAHASGLNKKVIVQTENFRSYAAGQALVVFRPPTELVHEIINVASITAKKENPWCIRLIDAKQIWKKISHLVHSILFERSTNMTPADKIYTKIARMAVDLHSKGGFYKKNGETLMPMSCVEFAANVINVSLVNKVFGHIINSQISRNEKINLIAQNLKKAQESQLQGKTKSTIIIPTKFSTPIVSSVNFVHFLLSHPEDFENVGYIGSAYDKLSSSDNPVIKLSAKPVVAGMLMHLIPAQSSKENYNAKKIAEILEALYQNQSSQNKIDSIIQTLHPKTPTEEQIAGILNSLNMLSDNGYVIPENIRDSIKIQTAFTIIYALRHHLLPQGIAYNLSSPGILKKSLVEFEAFKLKIKRHENFDNPTLKILKKYNLTSEVGLKKAFAEIYAKEKSQIFEDYLTDGNSLLYENAADALRIFTKELKKLDEQTSNAAPLTQPPIKFPVSKNRLPNLKLETTFIKASPDSNEKQFAFSMNYLEKERVKALNKVSFSERIIKIGIVALIIPPLGALLIGAGLVARYHFQTVEQFFTDWQKRVYHIFHATKPNTHISLTTNIGSEYRPWIHYSTDGGKSWDQEPLVLQEGNLWKAKIRSHDAILYKFFIGPKEMNHTDPLSCLKAWQKTADGNNALVPTTSIKEQKDGTYLTPNCNQPQWEWK